MTKDKALKNSYNEAERYLLAEDFLPIQDGKFKRRKDLTLYGGEKFYTPPAPAKEWVGLSDDELMELLVSKGETSIKYLDFARAIEAKLKEKNHE